VTSNRGGLTIGETLSRFLPRLEKTSDTPGLDLQVLLAHQLNKPRSWVLAHQEEPLTRPQIRTFETAVSRLEEGHPLAYVLGVWEFFGLEFEVSPDVLIPRPETELLVEHAIKWLKNVPSRGEAFRVMDVGIGSGCISIALAINVPDIIVTGTDVSPSTLKIAGKNAERMQVSNRFTFIEADLYPNHSPSSLCSLIVANLPYIPTKTLHSIPIYGREPTLALDGGPDGLLILRRFLEESPKWLLQGGLLLCEIEASEGPAVQLLAHNAFPNAAIAMHKDLGGQDRLLEVQT
jgi:release factor glutamine methyltransferase